MRPLLLLLLATGLSATQPQVHILSASVLLGPGRAPRPGDAPFHPQLTVAVAVDGLRKGDVPAFGLWNEAETRAGHTRHLVRIRVAAMAPDGPGHYRLLAAPEGGADGTIIVRLWLRGHWGPRAEAPLQRHALPAARPAGGQEA